MTNTARLPTCEWAIACAGGHKGVMGGAVFSEETELMVMEARAQAQAPSRKCKQPQMVMRLYILRGSFSGWKDSDACAGGGPAMDASVWSRLPEDVMWRVLRFVPAVKRFQLHSVSRKWRQELTTSPRFRNTITSDSSNCKQQRQQHGVVACTTPVPHAATTTPVPGRVDKRRRRGASAGRTETAELDPSLKLREAVDVDLTSFVPSWFWEPGRSTYSVVAAGDGMVCISNDMDFTYDYAHWQAAMASRRCDPTFKLYCVLNPLTRTAVVLPPLPFPPTGCLTPAAGAVTAYSDRRRLPTYGWGREVATFDLAAVSAGAGGWRWQVAPAPQCLPVPVQCAGETFQYHGGRLHVLAAAAAVAAAPGSEAEEEGVVLDGPSVALLGLDAATVEYRHEEVRLVTHRGALFVVVHLRCTRRIRRRRRDPVVVVAFPNWTCTSHPRFAAGVWRLGRGDGGDPTRTAWWEPVCVLGVEEAERLVRPRVASVPAVAGVSDAFFVRDLLCCELVMGDEFGDPPSPCVHFIVGLQIDTGAWELVLGYEEELRLVCRNPENGDLKRVRPVELRPDLYLA